MTKSKKTGAQKAPRSRGALGLSIPEAGAMIGLSRNSAYEAAKKGDIPTIKVGGLLVVPRLIWLRMLGIEQPAPTPA